MNLSNSNQTLIIQIDPLIDGDDIATIQNNNTESFYYGLTGNDLGLFFDIVECSFTHSILDLGANSQILLTFNSNLDLATNLQQGGMIFTTGVRDRLNEFVRGLAGRIITVTLGDPYLLEIEQIVFKGYIESVPDEITVQSGTQIKLQCRTLLSQLEELSSNRNWDETIKAYGNIFTTGSGNFISFTQLMDTIFMGTLLEGSEYTTIDGDLAPIPNEVWACINPNKTRMEVLREILIAYNRIVYQQPNGEIVIQPLFLNDMADKSYNVDAVNNDGNYIALYGKNNAAGTPNRIDVLFGIPDTGAFAGNTTVDNADSAVYCSAPYTTPDSAKIVPIPGNSATIQYTDIYKSSVRLYNSGKWVMPIQKPVEIGSVTNQAILANLLLFRYEINNVWSKPAKVMDNFARLYAQLFLAELNATNYNASIIYDGTQVSFGTPPLCQIVTINNYNTIDYPQMIVTHMTTVFDLKNGFVVVAKTSPLMSITASWGSI